jgi:hypothetical protein
MEGLVSSPDIVWKDGKFGQTSRRDAWWLSPAAIFLGFGAFLVYANWAAFQNSHYTYGPYISPFYSPELFGSSPHALFGPKPGWYPNFLPFSPALDPRPVPPDLLLLPRGLLQIVLGRSSGMCGERAAQELSGGTNFSAHHAEFSSLLFKVLLHCLGFSGL